MFNIGNVYFDVISIGIIVILIINMIVGLKKGFLGSLLSLSTGLLTFIAATALCVPLANLLVKWGWGESMQAGISDKLFSQNQELFKIIITNENKETLVAQGLSAFNLPSFLSSMMINLMNPYIGEKTTFAYAFSNGLTRYCFIAICYIALLIIFGIIFMILKRFAKKLNNVPVLGPLNRIAGMVLMLALGYLIIDAALFGLSNLFMMNVQWLDGVSGWMSQTLYLNNDGIFSLSKFMYTNSLTSKIIGLFVR